MEEKSMATADDIKNLQDRVGRLESAVGAAIVDPAGPWTGGGGVGVRPHGPIGDPAPIDVSRFSAAQLQSSLHSISAEKTRLAAMEGLINQELEKRKAKS
jgi:hypothetical protein